MKILVVASLAFSLVNFRGRLLADMAAGGHEVIAVAPDHDDEIRAELAAIGVGYRAMPMARAGLNPFVDLVTLAWLVRLMVGERPDVVLAYTQKPIIYSGIASRIAGRPRYFAMVSGLGHAFGDGGARWLRTIVARLYGMALARAEAVFVFNADDHAEMLKHAMIKRDVPVVRVAGSGIDFDRFKAVPVPSGPIRFVMIARLLRSKGLFEYVEAARAVRAKHPDVRFDLVGPLDPNPAGIGVAQVGAWQAEGVIGYLGEIRDVRPILASASVFVLPSWYREGLPRTILEAMATGRAVVTTDMPGCREPIEEGVNGYLVAPRDPCALAAAMERFVIDPDSIAVMGAKARETAVAKYAVERVNEAILSTMALRASDGRTVGHSQGRPRLAASSR